MEVDNLLFMSTCRQVNRHLEILLNDVYHNMFQNDNINFKIPVIPILSLDTWNTAFDMNLISDNELSVLLTHIIGYPLSKEGCVLRNEKRKREMELSQAKLRHGARPK